MRVNFTPECERRRASSFIRLSDHTLFDEPSILVFIHDDVANLRCDPIECALQGLVEGDAKSLDVYVHPGRDWVQRHNR